MEIGHGPYPSLAVRRGWSYYIAEGAELQNTAMLTLYRGYRMITWVIDL